jgi:hypothetical protein
MATAPMMPASSRIEVSSNGRIYSENISSEMTWTLRHPCRELNDAEQEIFSRFDAKLEAARDAHRALFAEGAIP